MPEYLIEVHRTALLPVDAPDEMQARGKAADVAWAWCPISNQDSVATRVLSGEVDGGEVND